MTRPFVPREARFVRGAAAHNAKLTDDQVRAIRQRWREDHGWGLQVAFAKLYGVSPTVICHIVHGRLWKHVKDDEE